MTATETLAFFHACLPGALYLELARIDPETLCEVHLRANRPVQFKTSSALVNGAYTPSPGDIENIGESLAEHALYARYDEMRRGFVTLRGGHRMGLCGRVLFEKEEAVALSDIASLCVRVAREVKGCAKPLLPYVKPFKGLPNILILGGPGSGKTTLLRDLVYTFSTSGITVGLNDERGELAACLQGVPQLDVGVSTDVLDGCQKAYGIRWLTRSMAPAMVATDELSGMDDAMALLDARACGIGILATVHAGAMSDLALRSDLSRLSGEKAFDMYVLLKNRETGVIEAVYNKEGQKWH